MRFILLVSFAALAVPGCGDTMKARVSGTVSYQGKPVPHALMNFHIEGDGPMAYAMTDEDGSYEVFTGSERGLQAGAYRVVIESPTGLELPKKYSAIDTSGLKFDIKEGRNHIDIPLE